MRRSTPPSSPAGLACGAVSPTGRPPRRSRGARRPGRCGSRPPSGVDADLPSGKVTGLAHSVGDALDRADHIRRVHLGAAAALELGPLGPPADHRDPSAPLTHPGAARRRWRAARSPRSPRRGRRSSGRLTGSSGHRPDGAVRSMRSRTRCAACSTSSAVTSPASTAAARWCPSTSVGRASRGRARRECGGAVRAEPVGHHHAVEPPLAPQQVGQQPGVLAAVPAVDAVVGRHDGPDAGAADGGLEGRQVELATGRVRRPRRRSPCGPSPGRCRRSA